MQELSHSSLWLKKEQAAALCELCQARGTAGLCLVAEGGGRAGIQPRTHFLYMAGPLSANIEALWEIQLDLYEDRAWAGSG